MPSFNDPIKPISASDDNPIKISRVEANKHKKPYEEEANKQNHPSLAVVFLIHIKTLLDKLSLNEEELFSSFEKESLAYYLQSLATLFNQLKAVDLNPEIIFYHALSSLWQKILQSTKIAKQTGVKTYININKLETLILEIETFPPGEERALGYYLKEPPVGNWHPIPFREIIKKLYNDHLQKNTTSTLTIWTQCLEEITHAKE